MTEPYARVCKAIPYDENPNWYQPGGCMIIINGPLAGRVRKTGSDKYGRWCWTDLEGKAGRKCKIYSVYMVSQQSAPKGMSTYYHQLVRQCLRNNKGIRY